MAAGLCALIGGMTDAQAVPVSAITTGTADVVFRETGTASITVTPVSPLQAGRYDTRVIASATASASSGAVAYRWSPSGSEARGEFSNLRTLSGRANAANRLSVSSVANATLSGDSPSWYFANNGASSLDITVLTAQGEQAVAADTYVVSLDAAVWGE